MEQYRIRGTRYVITVRDDVNRIGFLEAYRMLRKYRAYSVTDALVYALYLSGWIN